MDCPECGSTLVTYRLADREAPVCEQCGHVGIEAEHRGARVRVESWSDALRRFYGTTDADADDESTVPIRSGDRREGSERARVETWAEALRRFYGTADDESR
jgi:DNA-directed RNA polymerase subunit M/transcription elongation factor TFIIS